MGARTYSPTLGRFMQTDPIFFEGGMNLYAYAGNNPVNVIDPLGLTEAITVTGRICNEDCREAARRAAQELFERIKDEIGSAADNALREALREALGAFCEGSGLGSATGAANAFAGSANAALSGPFGSVGLRSPDFYSANGTLAVPTPLTGPFVGVGFIHR